MHSGALFPSKSGLIHKHIVKTNKPCYPSIKVQTSTQTYGETYRRESYTLQGRTKHKHIVIQARIKSVTHQFPSMSLCIHQCLFLHDPLTFDRASPTTLHMPVTILYKRLFQTAFSIIANSTEWYASKDTSQNKTWQTCPI
jgi:hypothetical protein